MEISNAFVAGGAIIALGTFLFGYGLGWGQCTAWRDGLDQAPSDDERLKPRRNYVPRVSSEPLRSPPPMRRKD
jgi:hypothetical protein